MEKKIWDQEYTIVSQNGNISSLTKTKENQYDLFMHFTEELE